MTTLEKNFHIEDLLNYLHDYAGELSKIEYFEQSYSADYTKSEMEQMKIELKQL